jgi:hypothetical protein
VRVQLPDLGRFDVGPGKRLTVIPGFRRTTEDVWATCCSMPAFARLIPRMRRDAG